MERWIKPGSLIAPNILFIDRDPIEVTKLVSKTFIDGVYMYMLGQGGTMRRLGSPSYKLICPKPPDFDQELTEVFVENHRVWTEK